MRLCQTCGRLHDDGTETCPRDGAKLADFKPTLSVGQKVAGKFSIVGAIGVGQSGEVYEGRSEDDGGRVVVRLLAADVAKDKRLSDVVRRHLLKQQEFEHKYVVRTRAVDQYEDRILFVRDWVEGRRLEDVLTAEGALGVQRTLGLGIRICSALAEAHKVGLLHLQLRASNVFVVPGEEEDAESVRLVDFGVGPRCKVGPRPYYGVPKTLSPEQIEGKIVSFKSDMFAAGLLLYRMLAGQHAFDGPDDVVVKQICESPVPPIKYRAADPVPMELWAFVRQALEKKPIHRPIGMAQMADRLKELAGDAAAGRLSLEPPAPGEAGTPPAAPQTDKSAAPAAAERMPIGRIALRKRGPEGEGKAAEPPAGDRIEVDVVVEEPAAAEPAATSAPVARTAGQPEAEKGGAEPREETVAAKPGDEKEGEAPTAGGGAVASAGGSGRPGGATAVVGMEAPKAAVGAKAPPPPPKTAGKPVKGEEEEGPKSSSDTMPMEPEIIEEVAIPPPMRKAGAGRGGAAGTVEQVLAATFRRGLFYGLGIGLAVAIVAFFLGRFAGRPQGEEGTGEARTGAAGTTGEGSPGALRLTAEGPMQVSVVDDAGNGAVAGATDAAAAPAPEREDVPAAEAEPIDGGGPADVPSVDAVVREDDATGPEDALQRREDRAAAPETATEPAVEAGRPTETRADAGRAGSGAAVSAEDLARANELVSQGDTALAARNFAAAQSAYEEALRLHPQNNRAKIGLGRTAFQQGNFADAVRYLEPIYRNQGNMDLGMAYVRVGRLEDAKRQFEKLLERNPNNSDAQRALEAVQRQLGQ